MVSGNLRLQDPDRSSLHLRAVRGRRHRPRQRDRGGAGRCSPSRSSSSSSATLADQEQGGGVAVSIILDGLTKRFAGRAVVEGVKLEIADGELFVLLGASGSGKSTILRMIAGLTSSDGGRIQLMGTRRDGSPAPEARRRLRLPELLDLPAHDRGQEHRVRPEDPARAARGAAPQERGAARPRRPGGAGRPLRARALRRPAAARGPGAGARLRAKGPPAGRALRGARRQDPVAASPELPRDPAEARGHHGPRHPRPGRGLRDRRPHRRHGAGPPGRGRARGGAVLEARLALRGDLRRRGHGLRRTLPGGAGGVRLADAAAARRRAVTRRERRCAS